MQGRSHKHEVRSTRSLEEMRGCPYTQWGLRTDEFLSTHKKGGELLVAGLVVVADSQWHEGREWYYGPQAVGTDYALLVVGALYYNYLLRECGNGCHSHYAEEDVTIPPPCGPDSHKHGDDYIPAYVHDRPDLYAARFPDAFKNGRKQLARGRRS